MNFNLKDENFANVGRSVGVGQTLSSEQEVVSTVKHWGVAQPVPARLVRTRILSMAVLWTMALSIETALLMEINRYGWPTLMSLPFVLACLALNWKFWIFSKASLAQPTKEMIADSDRKDEMLIRMWVEQSGVVTGADKGVLWVEANALWFHGERSWFCLPRQEIVTPPRTFGGQLQLGQFKGDVGIDVAGIRIRFQSVLVPRSIPTQPGLELTEELGKFLADESRSELPLDLPPLETDPTYVGRLVERPDTAQFRRLMTSRLYSTRWYFFWALNLCFVLNPIVNRGMPAGHTIVIGGSVMIALQVSVLIFTQRLAKRLRKDSPPASIWFKEVNIASLRSGPPVHSGYFVGVQPSQTPMPEREHVPTGTWLESPAETMSALQNLKRGVSRVTWCMCLAELVLFAFAVSMHLVSVGSLVYFLAGFLATNCVLLSLLKPIQRPEKSSEFRQMISETDIPVRAWIEVNGVVVGADVGRFSIAQNAVHFEGLRSRFRIARQDVNQGRPRLSWTKREILSVDFGYTFELKRTPNSTRVTVQPIYDLTLSNGEGKPLAKLVNEMFGSVGGEDNTSILPPTSFDEAYCLMPYLPKTEIISLDRAFVPLLIFPLSLFVIVAPYVAILPMGLILFMLTYGDGSILPGHLRAKKLRAQRRTFRSDVTRLP